MKNTVGNHQDSSFSSAFSSGANVALMSIADLQIQCGVNAKKSGWHADRPKLEDFPDLVHDQLEGYHHDAYEKALRNWQGMKIMLMVSELAEGVEELRAGHAANETYYNPIAGKPVRFQDYRAEDGAPMHKPEGLPSELADTVIRILDFCYTEEIDLQSMIQEKLDFNQTRGQKHGGKAV